MTAHTTLLTLGGFLARAWSAIGPLIGVLIGSWLTRSWQRKQWVLDSKKTEYRELISTLSHSYHTIAKNAHLGGMIFSVEQLTDRSEASEAGKRVIEDRLFIVEEMRKENIRELWARLAAENEDEKRLAAYWNDLYGLLMKMAHRDLGIESEPKDKQLPKLSA